MEGEEEGYEGTATDKGYNVYLKVVGKTKVYLWDNNMDMDMEQGDREIECFDRTEWVVLRAQCVYCEKTDLDKQFVAEGVEQADRMELMEDLNVQAVVGQV